MLDIRSMIACNNVAADRMKKLMSKYGKDTVDEASERLINESEERFRQRLLELPDGEWQSRQYLSANDETAVVRLTMTKKADTLTFDFSGCE